MKTLLIPFAALLLAAPALAQSQVTIVAEDSKSMASVTSQNWNDNRFRAYWNSASAGFVDGFVRFDLSAVPSGAVITGLTLRAYHEAGFNNPLSSPMVNCYRVSDDSWARGAIDTHPGLNEQLTPTPLGGFPSANLVPVDFVLDVNAASWGPDLIDGKLSLALRNENGSSGIYSYVYFHGSDPEVAGVNKPPDLIVDYNSGPSVAVNGSCPGPGTIVASGMTPGGTVYFGYSLVASSWTIPVGSCAGTVIPLVSPVLLSVETADGGGNASVSGTMPQAGCGAVYVLCFDVTTCTPTNTVLI